MARHLLEDNMPLNICFKCPPPCYCFLLVDDSILSLDSWVEFWTGVDCIPPYGFPITLSLSFFFSRVPRKERLPSCTIPWLVLHKPIGQSFALYIWNHNGTFTSCFHEPQLIMSRISLFFL